jgi:DNA-binding NtrC family response regulator
MRKRHQDKSSEFKILIVDDEPGIIDSLSIVLKRSGYLYEGFTDPLEAIEKVRKEHFDLMILDYLMTPIHGDEVVKRIRDFKSDLYILLLTGHKDLAPPLETIKALEIQGYCEKSDRFDQLQLLVESGIKSITMMKTIKHFRDGLNRILESVPKIYQLQPIGNILEEILAELLPLLTAKMLLFWSIISLMPKSREKAYSGE